MRIQRIKILESARTPLLSGLEVQFFQRAGMSGIEYPKCFVGVNGTGKSQLLESFAAIFFYLDKLATEPKTTKVATPLLFEIDYSISVNSTEKLIEIRQLKYGRSHLSFRITDSDGHTSDESPPQEIHLPTKIVGYTSGENETLSFSFAEYYANYALFTASRAIYGMKRDDYEPRFYLMTYSTSIATTICNLLLQDQKIIDEIFSELKIHKIHSFRITMQTKHKAARGRDGIVLTKEHEKWIEQLSRIATCWDYQVKENKYVLDFYCNEETIKGFRRLFVGALELYTALYKLELLNLFVLPKKQRDPRKKDASGVEFTDRPSVPYEADKAFHISHVALKLVSGEIVDYSRLSDGEHQYLNLFGAMLMTNSQNSLFLLDEPETHFNPKWRRRFVSTLLKISAGRNQDFFLTSHSPFLVSDSYKENVLMFRRNGETGLTIENPRFETYGSSSDHVLEIAFDMPSSVSERSLSELEELLNSQDINEVRRRLSEFGDSEQKLLLHMHLAKLMSESSK